MDPPRPSRAELTVVKPADVEQLLGAAGDTPYYTLIYTALYTGMRRGELLALRWSNVDLDMAVISVTHSLLRRYGGEFVVKEPKSGKSRRTIALPPSLALLLRKHRFSQAQERDFLGLKLSDDDLLFAKPDGAPLDPTTVSHAFQKVARRVGLPGVRFHDPRHTHASLMLRNGVHPKIVSERLGHSSVAITLDVYSHVTPGLQEAAALRFDDVLRNCDEAAEGQVIHASVH